MSRAVVFASLLLASGCWEATPDGPPLGYERDERACADDRDNDRDGLVDCADPDCLAAGFCGELIPEGLRPSPENTLEACSDMIDNDLDGQFDCGDRDCQNIRETCCGLEFSDVACSDGIDNDGNGFIDCEEFSCRSGFVTVCDDDQGGEERCDDQDSNDEDGDDLANCFDPDCFKDVNCPEAEIIDSNGRPAIVWLCNDGVDNDNDGSTDCEDPSCAKAPECKADENTLSRCMDGVDNDGNGYIDCNDFSCSRLNDAKTNQATVDYCATLAENTAEACSDGIDNDQDTYIDCDDRDCTGPAVAEVCNAEDTLAECQDGEDNDGNGFVDCADFSCSRADDQTIVDYCEQFAENTYAKCKDGIDNDGNGYTDCQDRGCNAGNEGFVNLFLLLSFQPFSLADGSSVTKLVFPCQETLLQTYLAQEISFPVPQDIAGHELVAEEVVINREIQEQECQQKRDVNGDGLWSCPDCVDGVDNDRDGFVDCDDWQCSWHPSLNPGAVTTSNSRRGDWPNDYDPALHPCIDPQTFEPLVCGG